MILVVQPRPMHSMQIAAAFLKTVRTSLSRMPVTMNASAHTMSAAGIRYLFNGDSLIFLPHHSPVALWIAFCHFASESFAPAKYVISFPSLSTKMVIGNAGGVR